MSSSAANLDDSSAEIGLAHGRIGLDLARAALGDLLAEIQHGDAVSDAHHQLHHMLDDVDAPSLPIQLPEPPVAVPPLPVQPRRFLPVPSLPKLP